MQSIVMYGAEWCPDCQRTKRFLEEHPIPFEYRDIQADESAVRTVEEINNGKRVIPTLIVFNEPVTNPSPQELARLLGINPVGRVILFGADWCPDCRRAKAYLDQQKINYMFIDVDRFDWAATRVETINNGKRIIPTILVNDKPYTNPSNNDLRDALQLEQVIETNVYDAAIIGAGAAGLTAAIYLGRETISAIMLEKKTVGGNAFLTDSIENYPGFTHISGPDLMDKMREQAETYGAAIREGVEVRSMQQAECEFELNTSEGLIRAKAVIVSVGSTYRRLEIPGEEELVGAGIHFCATCDGPFYRGRSIIVIGGGNSALEEGLYLAEFCEHVTFVHRKPEFSASKTYLDKLPTKENVSAEMNKTPVQFIANEQGVFESLKIRDNETGEESLLEADGVFIFIGLIPNTAFLKSVVELDDKGFIVTAPDSVQTNVPGVFAAGDCRRNAVAQVAAATGEGVLASYAVRDYLRKREPGHSGVTQNTAQD